MLSSDDIMPHINKIDNAFTDFFSKEMITMCPLDDEIYNNLDDNISEYFVLILKYGFATRALSGVVVHATRCFEQIHNESNKTPEEMQPLIDGFIEAIRQPIEAIVKAR